MKFLPQVLLVGAGKFGSNYVRILKDMDTKGTLSLKGVCVRNPDKYKKLLGDRNIPVHKGISQAILKGIDAVIIVTPVESHFEIAAACLKYCHVFVEKPVATTLEQAKRLQKIARRNNRIFIVGHIFRFNDTVDNLKDLLGKRPLPRKIVGSFINPIETDQGRDPSTELLHLYDMIDYLWQKDPLSVYSSRESRKLIVNLRYSDACDANLVLGWNGDDKVRILEFHYSHEVVRVDLVKNLIEVSFPGGGKEIVRHEVPKVRDSLESELQDFFKKVKSGKHCSNIEMASRVLSIALRAVEKVQMIPKVAVIGGGIFGISVADQLGKYCNVTLFEKNHELMQEGTMINQFRHHYGYHYPRSDETVVDVQCSRADFEDIFKDALYIESPTYYALAKCGSKVNVPDFIKFCKKHRLPYKKEYPPNSFLSRCEVDLSIRVPEPSYRHSILKKIAYARLKALPNIKTKLDTIVEDCDLDYDGMKHITYLHKEKRLEEKFDYVINATYANINRFTNWLNFPSCPIRIDLAEVLIVKIPVSPVSVTVIDGQFATLMPTGNKNEFTLYHVKESIIDRYVPLDGLLKKVIKHKSNREAIFRESLKFFPILKNASIIESRIVHRGVQAFHEHDDSRVADLIDHGFGCWSILSGKILSSVTMAKRLSGVIKTALNHEKTS